VIKQFMSINYDNYAMAPDNIKELLRLGFALIPVHAPSPRGCTCIAGKKCGAPGKHPRISDWGNKWSKDPDVIDQWLTKWPGTNIGIVTGEPSGIVVIDVDPRNGGVDALDDLQRKFGKLPETWMVLTGGGGYHYYFKLSIGVRLPKELCAGVDIKGDGGMVLAPGSLHVSGKRYEWEVSSCPGEVGLADLPEWVISCATNIKTTAIKSADNDPVYAEGGRNDKLTSLAGSMRKRGMSETAILAALREENKEKCLPPLPDDEVQTIAKSAGRWEPGAPALSLSPDQWERPIPFNEYLVDPFPVDVFPQWLKVFVNRLAVATQTPPDLAGMLALAMLGACTSRIYKVMARQGWVEPLNIYVLIVLLPGNRKSAVQAEVIAPLQDYEAELVKVLEQEYRQAQAIREATEQALVLAKSEYAKSKTKANWNGKSPSELEEEIKGLTQQIADSKELSRPRLLVDDATVEVLVRLMAEQNGPIALFSAEGGFIGILAGRYNQGNANVDAVNKAFNCEPIRVDRIGREPDFVQNPALTLGLAVQPAVIKDLASKPEFRWKGLNARFLYSVPTSTLGHREIDAPPLPENIRAAYGSRIRRLLQKTFPPTYVPPEQKVIILGGDAQYELKEFERWIEPRLSNGGDLEPIQDWAAKLAGAIVRIAGLLHIAENVEQSDPASIKITGETMKNAVKVGHYLISHARNAFDAMGANEELEKARAVLHWITTKGISEFSKRDCHYENQPIFKRSIELDSVLGILEDRFFIRKKQSVQKEGPGRKPSPVYEINPYMTQLIELTELKESSNCIKSVNSVTEESFDISPIENPPLDPWAGLGHEVDLSSREGGDRK
jgi:hypothetical protein